MKFILLRNYFYIQKWQCWTLPLRLKLSWYIFVKQPWCWMLILLCYLLVLLQMRESLCEWFNGYVNVWMLKWMYFCTIIYLSKRKYSVFISIQFLSYKMIRAALYHIHCPKNMLTRRKESDIYLATDSRHHWSRQIMMKIDKFWCNYSFRITFW